MSKDDFIARYADELTGLLLASFAEVANRGNLGREGFAGDGRVFIHQMRRARDLLGRVFDDLKTKEPLPVAVPQLNGQPKPAAVPQPAGVKR